MDNNAAKHPDKIGNILSFLDRVFPYVQMFYGLIKPRAHTRLAWIVVVGGIGISTTPLWIELANALLNHWLNLKMEGTSPWVGVSLVAIGLAYHLLFQMTQSDGLISEYVLEKENLDHDSAILSALSKLYREDDVHSLCSSLTTDDTYLNSQLTKLLNTLAFIQKRTNEPLVPEIQDALATFYEAGSKLLDYLGLNFFVYPNNQSMEEDWRYALYPDLNCERAGGGLPDEEVKYYEAQKELDDCVKTFRSSFEGLVTCLKMKYRDGFSNLGF